MTRLPAGFRVRLRHDVRRLSHEWLVGGSPLRVLRLRGPGAAAVGRDGLVEVDGPASQVVAGHLLDANLADPVLDGTVDPADLTVVIPVRGRPEQLTRTLDGVAGLRCIVVDDASPDPVPVAAAAQAHGADLVRLTVNVGPAGARNAGLARVRTPFVAFTDSDVVADRDVLLRLARHFDDDRVALVGPLVRSRSRAPDPQWFERYDEGISSLALGDRACSVGPGAAVAWLPSACLVGRVDRLGDGFDAAMRVGEDVDLVWRLIEAGHVVRYDPSETVHHDTRRTVRGWLGRKYVYGTGGADLAARHGDKLAPAVLSPTMAVAAAAVLARRRWSLPVAAVGLGVALRALDRRLPAVPGRRRVAVRLAGQGLGWAVRQESALLLRHWWPLAAVGAVCSRTVRRAAVTAVLVDAVVSRIDHPDAPYAPVSRRLDDLAYGAGLWVGAARARSPRCLLPRRPGRYR